MTAPYKKTEELDWVEHFMKVDGKNVDGNIKFIYTKEKDESPITVMMVKLKKGVSLPEHVHPDQPDLVYVLEGKATMFIDGEGEFPLLPGMVVQVPPNTSHAMRNVEEELLVYNVFSPAIR
jgi:quercetin dioxygenase-like cupin family protein